MLTEAWTQLRFHSKQSACWRTKARWVGLACGRGSGKTELARRRVVRFLPVQKPWSNPLYFYALPTFNQARRVAWRPLLDLIPSHWIKKKYEGELRIETVFGSELYVLGLDKPHRAEGVQWDGGVIDESSDQKPGVFDRTFRPAMAHRNAWCWRIGVPKRFGIGAREFRNFCENTADEYYNWPSADILSEEEVKSAREQLSEADFNEQFGASWLDIGGRIFYAYSMENVSTEAKYHKDRPLVISSDFNVNPMCWVVGHRWPDRLEIFDEIFKRNTNTPEVLDLLFKRYGDHEAGFEFYGDASARARKTSAAKTDVQHIHSDNRFKGKRVLYTKSNPAVTDRFAVTNGMLRNAAGRHRLFIHPRCSHLLIDLEDRQYKEGSREPDDHDDLGHMTDALGYVIYIRFPMTLGSAGRVGARSA